MGILNSISCFTFSLMLGLGASAFGTNHTDHGHHGDHAGEKTEHSHQAELPAAAGGEQVIKVKGMVCEICAAGIKKKLMKEKEVKSVDVKIKDHEVKITYKDPADTLSRERLGVILKEAGYELN